jgi:hypothetical protein
MNFLQLKHSFFGFFWKLLNAFFKLIVKVVDHFNFLQKLSILWGTRNSYELAFFSYYEAMLDETF